MVIVSSYKRKTKKHLKLNKSKVETWYQREIELMDNCCLMPTQQFFSCIMARTSYI
jgi:hypothetical protein